MKKESSNGTIRRLGAALRQVYSPKYILLNIVTLAAYVALFYWLVSVQNNGLEITVVPSYMIYSLAAASSVLFTVTTRAFLLRRSKLDASAGAIGTAAMFLGGLFGGCGCSAPILFSLVSIGIGTTGIVSFMNAVSANIFLLFSLMIAINLFAAIYYLNRISKSACKVR
jgi:hypothetical protein